MAIGTGHRKFKRPFHIAESHPRVSDNGSYVNVAAAGPYARWWGKLFLSMLNRLALSLPLRLQPRRPSALAVFGWAAIALASPLSAGCSSGCDGPVATHTDVDCRTSGVFTVSAPAEFVIACPPKVSWYGSVDAPGISVQEGCLTDDFFGFDLSFEDMDQPGTYPISHVFSFFRSYSRTVSTAAFPPTLVLEWGTVDVTDRTGYGIEGDLHILLKTDREEMIELVGHFVADQCKTSIGKSCAV